MNNTVVCGHACLDSVGVANLNATHGGYSQLCALSCFDFVHLDTVGQSGCQLGLVFEQGGAPALGMWANASPVGAHTVNRPLPCNVSTKLAAPRSVANVLKLPAAKAALTPSLDCVEQATRKGIGVANTFFSRRFLHIKLHHHKNTIDSNIRKSTKPCCKWVHHLMAVCAFTAQALCLMSDLSPACEQSLIC